MASRRASRRRSSTASSSGLCGLSPRLQRRLFGPPPTARRPGARPRHPRAADAGRAGRRAPRCSTGCTRRAGARRDPRRGAAVVERAAAADGAGRGARDPRARRRRSRPASTSPLGAAAEPPAPLLVYFHGGGWVIGDLETHDGVCRFLAAHGRRRGALGRLPAGARAPLPGRGRRRLAPPSPGPPTNAAELGADPARIAVGGDSAGGNLAAVVCLADARRRRPAAGDAAADLPRHRRGRRPAARATLFAEGFLLTQSRHGHGSRATTCPTASTPHDPRVSILRAADLSGLPPAYVATAGFDPLRDEGEAYALRMREAGVRGRAAPPPRPDPRLRQPDRGLPHRARGDARGRRGAAHGPGVAAAADRSVAATRTGATRARRAARRGGRGAIAASTPTRAARTSSTISEPTG